MELDTGYMYWFVLQRCSQESMESHVVTYSSIQYTAAIVEFIFNETDSHSHAFCSKRI